uniref:Thioredoxin-like protein 4B n=1 Tax=Vitis vinifera TaxID=29760 RepID=A5B4E4_VITVI|nr:hypothetical protein VITISV_044060 [Vitis vinifera]
MSFLMTTLREKKEVDSIIRDTIDKVLVLRFGRSTDSVCLHLDDIVIFYSPFFFSFSLHHLSLLSLHQFLFAFEKINIGANACKRKLSKSAREVSKFATVALVDIDSEDIQVYVKSADHTKWVGAFDRKQDFIDVVEAIFRGAMKGKLIVTCPLPPERIPKYQLLYRDL